MWDRNPWYKSKMCLVCGIRTRSLAAPIGIVSGSFPCCMDHDNRTIITAYLQWAAARQTQEERSS